MQPALTFNLFILSSFPLQFTTLTLYEPGRVKKEPSPTFQTERDSCIEFFNKWNESDQVDFVEQLLARMCHYQHGHINAYLKPMLQRDFISLLPSKCCNPFFKQKILKPPTNFRFFFRCCYRERSRSHCRKCPLLFGCGFAEGGRAGVQRMVTRNFRRNAVEKADRTQSSNRFAVAWPVGASRMDSIFIQTTTGYHTSTALILSFTLSENYERHRKH